jgi:hypothetical protein
MQPRAMPLDELAASPRPISWYDAKCVKHVHKAGDFFTEADRAVHELRNGGSTVERHNKNSCLRSFSPRSCA